MLNLKKLVGLVGDLESCWMTPIREQQREYNKSRILNKNDGSDWRRELL